jgi:hypothetical protein
MRLFIATREIGTDRLIQVMATGENPNLLVRSEWTGEGEVLVHYLAGMERPPGVLPGEWFGAHTGTVMSGAYLEIGPLEEWKGR